MEVVGGGGCPRRWPLNLRIRQVKADPLPCRHPRLRGLVGDLVLKLRKRLSVSTAGVWFDFTVRRPAHFLPGWCCCLCQTPQGSVGACSSHQHPTVTMDVGAGRGRGRGSTCQSASKCLCPWGWAALAGLSLHTLNRSLHQEEEEEEAAHPTSLYFSG